MRRNTLIIIRTIWFSTLFLALLGTVASAEDSIEDVEIEILTTTERLNKLDKEINEGRALKAKLTQALKESEQRIGERNSRISGLDKDISQFNNQLDRLDAQIVQEQSDIEKRKLVLADSIRRAQQIASSNGLKVVLQNDDPAEADRLGVYTSYFMKAQQQAIDKQQDNLRQINSARTEALKNRNWLNHIKKKASSQADGYKNDRDKRKQSIGEVDSQITSKTKTVAELKLDQARLQALMEELRAAQVARSGYFESGQGTYKLPVNGTIEARFGDVKSVGKLRWEGYFIQADSGTPVRAIADGEVVYSDWLTGFGMLVIVDHGDSYMTLYGGNREVTVSQGEWTESGSTIATVGDSGGQKNAGVYFEIRHNAKPVDPKSWVGPTNGGKTAKK